MVDKIPFLSIITFFPIVGIFIISLMRPEKEDGTVKKIAVITTLVPLALTTIMIFLFKGGGIQFAENANWIPRLHIQYRMGVDGISLPMVFLTTLLSFIAVVASWKINFRVKEYFSLLLLLEVGMNGVFCALDIVLFYVFWELGLIPMYFLIGIWGSDRRKYAAIKFFLFTLLGSVVMLIGLLSLYFASDPRSFDLIALTKSSVPAQLQIPIFLAIIFGLAVKVPVFPLHTWLPDAHVEAPTAVSVLLAGVLLKMGTYGMLRIAMPILPKAFSALLPYFAIFAAINIVYGSFAAMAQTDLKRLVAYSSISSMGFVLLGYASLNQMGLNGAVMQNFNHGLYSALLFLVVGLIYDRLHTRKIASLGGISTRLPILGGVLAFGALAALGLPGLAVFVGEFSSLIGAFTSFPVIVIVSSLAIIITAAYFLWTVERVSFGPRTVVPDSMLDLSSRELLTVSPLMILLVVLGVAPYLLIALQSPTVDGILSTMGVK